MSRDDKALVAGQTVAAMATLMPTYLAADVEVKMALAALEDTLCDLTGDQLDHFRYLVQGVVARRDALQFAQSAWDCQGEE